MLINLWNTVLDHLPDQIEVGLDEPLNDLAVSLLSVIQLPSHALDRDLWQQVDRLHGRYGCAGRPTCLALCYLKLN